MWDDPIIGLKRRDISLTDFKYTVQFGYDLKF